MLVPLAPKYAYCVLAGTTLSEVAWYACPTADQSGAIAGEAQTDQGRGRLILDEVQSHVAWAERIAL